ncbi:hypothetical protein GCM10008932_16870 [Alkalibacterium iburiense]|uniref:DUF4064 domain-containing protein n=1 Tax=Alkalibacterium iburiense TaxID=290589 RepID=A0ABP3HB68_9LACT
MTRKTERLLMKTVGFWQICHGLFTIVYYSIINRNALTTQMYHQFGTANDIKALLIFINIFGTVMMGIGLFNLVAEKNYMKDNSINKIGIWLLVNAVFSYLIMDMISLVLGMSATVIYFAKNKSIRVSSLEKKSG